MNGGMNLTHAQARELVQKSLETRLDAFEEAAVTAHLTGCAECAAYAAETRALDRRLEHSLTERWPARKYSGAELEARLASMQSRLRRESMFRRASYAARLAGAAAALVLLIAGLVWLVQGTTRQPVAGGGVPTATLHKVNPAVTATIAVNPPKATETISQEGRVSIEEAGRLVQDYIFKNNPGMSTDAQFPLQEITTDEIWRRMRAQVFKVTDGPMSYESFLVKNGQVAQLGIGFGGIGVNSMAVADLDGNSTPELVFTFSFGSGIHQSSLGAVTEQNGELAVLLVSDLRYPGDLRLEKQDDRSLVLKQIKDPQAAQEVTLGMVRLMDGRLVVSPDLAEMTTYTSARFGLSLAYPADWKTASERADGEGYSGSSGFFALLPILQPGNATQDLTRACEWLANGSPAQYGDLPQISMISFDQTREGCLVQSTSNTPDARSALVFPFESGQLALLRMDTPHAQVITQSLHFNQALPTMTPAPIEMTPQAPAANGKLNTRSLGDLTLSEYAVVSASVDTPGHFEFNARIPEKILQGRSGWMDYLQGKGLALANQQLQPFGYRLVAANGQTFEFYKGSQLVKGALTMYFPVSSYLDEQGNGDFAMVVEDTQGRLLARKAGIEKWDDMLHRFTRPVFAGGRLITVERGTDPNDTTDRVVVKQDGQSIFTYTLAPSPVEEVVKTLGEWNGGWVLEVNGTLIVDGAIYNQKNFQADEIFNWTMLNGKPFFFFRRNGKVGAWYDGKELGVQYDEIIHYRCCEPAAFNVVTTPDALWFYALRDGVWYFVELGKR